jgi:hypothetical protein
MIWGTSSRRRGGVGNLFGEGCLGPREGAAAHLGAKGKKLSTAAHKHSRCG